ncbi:MAG: phosphoribosylformylglycinamidine cyclo-ligase [Planctomycetes bacterium]|nr:phosphoribosylformylglycinamidine cyclo-ligase [Planctomycetota bacterium]
MLTYKSAGVDTTKKDGVIDEIIRLSRKTYDPRVIDHPWGFAGLFSLFPKTGVSRRDKSHTAPLFARSYKSPTLVACSDGVGTKLKIAFLLNKHDTIGIDLVAMSINDLIVTGAEPLFFLDYISCGRVNEKIIVDIIKGIVAGCEQSGCALLGGETAEMPDFYPPSEYDLAGFAVGLVDKHKVITGKYIKPGDVVIGLSSSGLHSNGYSLVRRVFLEGLSHKEEVNKLQSHSPELGCTLGEELLKPTIIYAKAVKHILRNYSCKKAVKGIAHITGGGLVENIPRVLPKNVCVEINADAFPLPPIFSLIQKTGNIAPEEMQRVFNMGIGLVIIVDKFYASAIIRRLKKVKYNAYNIGKVTGKLPGQVNQVVIK